jgi:hypothetical protein
MLYSPSSISITVWIVAVLEGSKYVPKSADFSNFDSIEKVADVVSVCLLDLFSTLINVYLNYSLASRLHRALLWTRRNPCRLL